MPNFPKSNFTPPADTSSTTTNRNDASYARRRIVVPSQQGQEPAGQPSSPVNPSRLAHLGLNRFFTSAPCEHWSDISIYYYYRDETLTTQQNFEKYIDDIRKIQRDSQHATLTEHLAAMAAQIDASSDLFREGFEREKDKQLLTTISQMKRQHVLDKGYQAVLRSHTGKFKHE
ncbi:hypothetical protein BGZ74_011675 [Mortierella antarctica]|nr:hypothetical protein BGZ74_011675 [Mortierella antarctica]